MDQLDLPPALDEAPPDGGAESDADGADSGRRGWLGGAAGAAEGHLTGAQLDLPAALEVVPAEVGAGPRFPDMAGRAAYARSQKALKRATAKAAAAQQAASSAQSDLALAGAVLPEVGRMLGQSSGKKRVVSQSASRPIHYTGLALAAFLPARKRLVVGMNRKRLIAGASRFVIARQKHAFGRIVSSSLRRRLALGAGPEDALSIVVYTHEFDETRGLFRRCQIGQRLAQRIGQTGTHEQVLVQRGAFHFEFWSRDGDHGTFNEEWIVEPRIVAGSSAEEVLPGLRAGLPGGLSPSEPLGAEQTCKAFDFVLFAPMGDRASSNVRMFRMWGHAWDSELRCQTKGRYLFLPDTCMVHSHHRGKLQVVPLRFHTTRQYSIGSLLRLPSVQGQVAAAAEAAISAGFVRRLEPPPAEGQRLRVFFEILYGLDDDDASASGPSHGQQHLFADIRALLDMFNGDPLSRSMVHFCGAPGHHCCSSAEEARDKATVCALNIMLGLEATPCEARWTNTLPAFKRTLVRFAVHRLGVLGFLGESGSAAVPSDPQVANFEAESIATAEFLKELNGVRLLRARSYLANDQNVIELGVLTVVLLTADRLLYGLLGGPTRSAKPARVSDLLGTESSLIGDVLSNFASLLNSWLNGGALRRPWSVLDLLGVASSAEPSFCHWARAQIMRMAGALHRRYEQKFAGYPYCLFGLCDEGVAMEARRSIAEAFVAAPRCCLDTFSAGFREAFPDAESLLAPRAARLLRSSFDSLKLTTDLSERQNAELQATRPPRSGARDFTNYSRESVLKQSRAIHMRAGGDDVLKPKSLRAAGDGCQMAVMPLLMDAARPDIALPAAAARPDGSQQQLVDPGPGLPNAAGQHMSAMAELSASAVGAGSLVEVGSMCEPIVVTIPGCEEEPRAEVPEPARKRIGLNPYLQFKNAMMKAFKESVGGRTLTPQEITQVGMQAKERWQSMGDTSAHRELYELWRQTAAPVVAPVAPQSESVFRGVWGGGTRASPISAKELFDYASSHPWPQDAEVYMPTEFHVKPAPQAELIEDSRSYSLWGCRRNPMAVCKERLQCPLQAWQLVHAGLCNCIDLAPRAQSESGGLMLMVSGSLRRDSNVVGRNLAIVVGTSWSPRVMDLAMCHFEQPEKETTSGDALPFVCIVSRRVVLC